MPSVRRVLERPIECLAATAAILRAALRLEFLERRSSLPELVSRLKSAPRGGRDLDPRLVLGILETLLPLLPPYSAGRCVKRSLLLLDLWSRAGLAPELHLGYRGRAHRLRGHAWVTTGDAGIRTERPQDVLEAWTA